jgi:hypothetical protein
MQTSKTSLAAFAFLIGCAVPSDEPADDSVDGTGDALVVAGAVKLGPARQIQVNAIGYNPRFDDTSQPWSPTHNRDFAGALAESQASMIRYPGGTFANAWDYDRDAYFPAGSSNAAGGWVRLDKVEPERVANYIREATSTGNFDHYTVENLARVAGGASGVNVVFEMNMVTPGRDFYESAWGEALHPHPGTNCNVNGADDWCRMLRDRYQRFKRMLKRAQDNGITVRFVELGNEYYFAHPYTVETFPEGRDHGVAANYIADLLHRDFGDDIRVAATASMVFANGPRGDAWNSGLDNVLDRSKVRFVTLHAYKAFDKKAQYTNANFRDALATWQRQIENKLEGTGARRFLSTTEQPSRIWYTETNANWDGSLDEGEGTSAAEQKWAQSLADAYSTVFLYDRGDAAMLLQFFFNGLVRAAADDGHLLYNRALAMEPFMRASKGATSMRPLGVPGVATIDGTQRTLVNGICFDGQTPRCAVINLTGQRAQIDLRAAFRSTTVHLEGYASELDSNATPRRVTRDEPIRQVVLPPYSVVSIAPM